MKQNEWNEGLDHLDPDLVKKYVEQKDRLRQKRKNFKRLWLRFGALAACFVMIWGVILATPMLWKDAPGIIPFPDGTTDGVIPGSDQRPNAPGIIPFPDETTDGVIPGPDQRPNAPTVNAQIPSSAPQYYGSEYSSGKSSGSNTDANSAGISVTAKQIETLPDTYTFFDDWKQYEYRLLRMKTVKLLRGQEMTEEFYYLVPVSFATDFSAYDRFVIKDMAQFGYEHSVMYNQTQGKAEQLQLPLFGYRSYGYHLLGENFAAFDSRGKFDERLWNANEFWIEETYRAQAADTITQAETAIREEENYYGDDLYVHLLKDLSGEAATVLETIKSFKNGLFVPTFSSGKLFLSPEVQFHAVRYINGFATNERVSIWSKEWTDGDQDTYAYTNARFSEDDMNRLPDLTSAFASVKEALNNQSIKSPHFNVQEEIRNTTSGIFGWYAKTENGVIGIVRVTWCFYTENYQSYYDDAYYIVEYGSDECKAIDRDALLELLGDCETTYIYTGKYNEYGKDFNDFVRPYY